MSAAFPDTSRRSDTGAIRHVLLDIEGTTCPVAFVSEVLFPYSAEALPAYLAQYGREPELQPLLQELLAGWRQEEAPEAQDLLTQAHPALPSGQEAGQAFDAQALIPYLRWLIRRDRKVTAWKDLQGRLWREGYRSGALQATLFPEVPDTLRRWQRQGLGLSVYSSGSVAAQQLLYGHSQAGDLRPLFQHWFDTRIGAKQEPASYSAILQTLGCGAEAVLFLSDSLAELQAAATVGMAVVFSDRPGNPGRDPGGFAAISRLDAVDPTRWPHPLPPAQHRV
ncbi:MAG: acireductone synthase [Cyanobium sp.]